MKWFLAAHYDAIIRIAAFGFAVGFSLIIFGLMSYENKKKRK